MEKSTSTSSDRDDLSLKPELAKAFVAFQKELRTVKKDGKADAGQYDYTYATLDAIIEAVREPLANNGLSFTQPLSSSDDGKVVITTIVRHESGQEQSSSLHVNVNGLTPQKVGSVFTYYKRYSLGATLGIATEEDDDGKAGNTEPTASPAPKASPKNPVSAKQIDLIMTLAKQKGKDHDWFNLAMEKTKTSADASAVIEKLKGLDDATIDLDPAAEPDDTFDADDLAGMEDV